MYSYTSAIRHHISKRRAPFCAVVGKPSTLLYLPRCAELCVQCCATVCGQCFIHLCILFIILNTNSCLVLHNAGRSKPPIPYIPERDVIQEAVDSSANTLKLTLPHKVELRVPVGSKGTPEQFLVHVQQALDAIRQKGLLTAYEKANKDKEECIQKLIKVTEALANYAGEGMNPPKEKQ